MMFFFFMWESELIKSEVSKQEIDFYDHYSQTEQRFTETTLVS